jgi:hypothetical protein
LERVRVGGDLDSPNGGDGEGGAATTTDEHQPLPPLPPTTTTGGGGGRKSGGGLLSALSHSVKGFVDSDPEASRRNTISKTREQINQVSLSVSLSLFWMGL